MLIFLQHSSHSWASSHMHSSRALDTTGGGHWGPRNRRRLGGREGGREWIEKGEIHKIGLYPGPHAKIVTFRNIPKCAESAVLILSRRIICHLLITMHN